jgi:CelD/BcsL family acetyltransferase involved in cellulose biosynthesis
MRVCDDVTGSGFGEIVLRDGEQQLGRVVTEWRALAQRVEGSSYFQTPDWVLAWWEERGRPPTVVGLWRDASGNLEAVACLSKLREPLRRGLPGTVPVVTNSGSGRPFSADRCGWPVLPHRAAEVRDWATTHRWRGSLLLRHLDRRSAAECVPQGARLVITTRCPVLESTGDGWVRPVSKNLAKNVLRFRRRLEGMGVSFAWTPPEEMTPDAIDLLFALHASSRSLRGGSSFTPELHAAFHRRLVAAARPGCGPAMAIASHEGHPIAISYGFVWRDTYYEYQGGWDISYANLRVGKVLSGETIRLAELQGLRTIDYLRGTESYKYSWGAADVVDETWLVPRGLSGWVLAQKYRVARAVQARDSRRPKRSHSQGAVRPKSDANASRST